jgi:hexosaminidase
MKRTRLILLLNICALFVATIAGAADLHQRYPVIPWPDSVLERSGSFRIEAGTEILLSHDSIRNDAELFNDYLQKQYGLRLKVRTTKRAARGAIFLAAQPNRTGPVGSYELSVTEGQLTVRGNGLSGVFFGLQTVCQLLPAGKTDQLDIPCVEIWDRPRFAWRGMHLDVSRHFFPVSFVKRYIDHIARYKMNLFHWHLTDDQGWRIEIKRYPELQQVSAYRNGTRIGHYSSVPEAYDTVRYGGYYTQEEVREVVAYAAERHITVLPEIEMPGHALAALAAYPQLSCTGGPFQVGRTWGVFQDVYCPKEATFEFLQNVLDEVCALFPGEYVHIGGDECPKDRWKTCTHCQALIRENNLKDEHELQSWFVQRIERYLHSKGKRMIGWDEILEGGLSKDATVMSWRGYQGGIDAAKLGNDVVMTPTSYCYFDYYQSRNPGEPLAIGGFLPLDKVYRFEPVPDVLSPEEAKHILGVQANMWTEYIPEDSKVEYMVLPRMCALAEVAWTRPSSRNYDAFVTRLISHFKMLGYLGINYSKAVFDVESVVMPNQGRGISVELSTPYKSGSIRYTTNGKDPDANSRIYSAPFKMDQSMYIQSAVFDGTERIGNVLQQVFKVNYATGKEIALKYKPNEEYCRGGGFTLVNGITGALPWNGADWLGFRGDPLDATIDLGQSIPIFKVGLDALSDEGSWIHYPKSIEVFLSEDGKEFVPFGKLEGEKLDPTRRLAIIKTDRVNARYVRVVAENAGIIPEGKPGAGNPAWLFADEIIIE